ncbi:hypothetical protein DdX_18433 [Ditylenchus destructor]|uniref:Uncharacterized protein n=1 Tax=Ditylenchus destructor TaxID=166010 RepID=A0AAD4MK98_9BILA|nr:hypothetical protein DdX_18433 [Ditylenchus destructor]
MLTRPVFQPELSTGMLTRAGPSPYRHGLCPYPHVFMSCPSTFGNRIGPSSWSFHHGSLHLLCWVDAVSILCYVISSLCYVSITFAEKKRIPSLYLLFLILNSIKVQSTDQSEASAASLIAKHVALTIWLNFNIAKLNRHYDLILFLDSRVAIVVIIGLIAFVEFLNVSFQCVVYRAYKCMKMAHSSVGTSTSSSDAVTKPVSSNQFHSFLDLKSRIEILESKFSIGNLQHVNRRSRKESNFVRDWGRLHNTQR